MDETLSLGAWMKQRRRELDLTQEALAERTGCSLETVRKIEAGTQRPSRQLAELLAAQLAVPPAERADFVRRLRMASLPTQPPSPAAPPAHIRNLPIAATSLVGRATEIARLRRHLQQFEVRLVTLVGPPGIGKTRLALAVAASLYDEFADGVWLVELAPLTDAGLVAPTIATVLGVTEGGGQPLRDKLLGYLHEKQVLLVLDNFEHLPAAAALVDELMRAAPGLKVLATSRIPLRLYGEREYSVPPLRTPEVQTALSLDILGQYEAVQLFAERAQEVQPDFALTPENAGAVAQICVRLDGLPLAIELAAGRVRLFPPPALLARLAARLPLLTGGAHNLPARHQTLRGAITWSYDLLAEAERQLFRRLAVFQGGRSLEAIEAVCNAQGDLQQDVLDGVESLIEKNLLQQREGRDGEPRFWMLETIHEYAWEKLQESREAEELRRQHAWYYLRLVEEAEPGLRGAELLRWLPRLSDEQDNLRAALEWALQDGGRGQAEKVELARRLTGGLWVFWQMISRFSEGEHWIRRALEQGTRVLGSAAATEQMQVLQRARVKALVGIAAILFSEGNLTEARSFAEEGLALSREMDDKWGIANSSFYRGKVALIQEDYVTARSFCEESLLNAKEMGDKTTVANALAVLGAVAFRKKDNAVARTLFEESLALGRELGNKFIILPPLFGLGGLAVEEGDYVTAGSIYEESISIAKELGDRQGLHVALGSLGYMALRQGDYATARSLFEESLTISQEAGSKLFIPSALINLGIIALGQEEYATARKLLGRSISVAMILSDKLPIAHSLAVLAGVAVQEALAGRLQQDPPVAGEQEQGVIGVHNSEMGVSWATQRAARLLGAAEALLAAAGAPFLDVVERRIAEQMSAIAREGLGEEEFERIWQEGRALTLEEAASYALEEWEEGKT